MSRRDWRDWDDHRYPDYGLDYEDEQARLDRLRPRLAPGKRTLTSRLDPVQRKAKGPAARKDADAALERAAQGRGAGLPAELQRELERSTGTDLNAVRIHSGAVAGEAADAISAKAYTTGFDIHFAPGTYDPSSDEGRHLIAHEVAHTVQQSGARSTTPQAKAAISQPGDALETEADAFADAFLAGHAAPLSRASAPTISRQPADVAQPDSDEPDAWVGDLVASATAAEQERLPPKKLARARRHNQYWLRKHNLTTVDYGFGASEPNDERFAYYIAELQEENGLAVDGIAGPKTAAALGAFDRGQARRGQARTAPDAGPRGRAEPQGFSAQGHRQLSGSAATPPSPAGSQTSANQTSGQPAASSASGATLDAYDYMDALGNPTLAAALGTLATVQQLSRKLSRGTRRNEETGQGRDDLVSLIAQMRNQIAQLDHAGLKPAGLASIKAKLYGALRELTPYYEEWENAPILQDWHDGRTCNLTALAMALESVGKSANDFSGDREKVVKVATWADSSLKRATRTVDKGDGDWARLTGLRLPDFLQVVATAECAKGTSDAAISAAKNAAWSWITHDVAEVMMRLAPLFGVSATPRWFNANASATRRANPQYDSLAHFGRKHRGAIETEVDKRNRWEKTGSTHDKKAYESSRDANSAALDGNGLGDSLQLDSYKQAVRGNVGADLDQGRPIVVNLENHYVHLQQLAEDHIMVDDPGRMRRVNRKVLWDEARAMGYFKRWIVFA